MVETLLLAALPVAAQGLGDGWPLFSPLVGVLGTFVTGSATSSNILFTDFQFATGRELARTTSSRAVRRWDWAAGKATYFAGPCCPAWSIRCWVACWRFCRPKESSLAENEIVPFRLLGGECLTSL